GKETWESTFTAEGAGSTQSIEIPALKDKSNQPPAPPPIMPASPGGSAPGQLTPEPPPDTPAPPGWQMPVGLTALGLGVAGLAGGVVTTFQAKSARDKSNADGHCIGNLCDTEGTNQRNKGRMFGNIATAAYIAGGAFAAGGIVLVLTTPGRPKKG